MTAPSNVISPQLSRNQRTEVSEGADVEERSAFDLPTMCCAIENLSFLRNCDVETTPHSCSLFSVFERSTEQRP